MFDFDVVRAWKDAKYRRSLTPEQLAKLPPNPAGLVELSDVELDAVSGRAGGGGVATTAITCTMYSWGTWRNCGCGVPTTSITCTMYTWQGWLACGC